MPDARRSRFEAQAALTGGVGRPLGLLARPTMGAVAWSYLRQQWVASEWS